MSVLRTVALSFSIARRDLRGVFGRRLHALALLVLGVFLGVASVALVATSAQSLRAGAQTGALEAVGGDLSFRLFHRAPSSDELKAFQTEGHISLTAELRPQAHAQANANAKSVLVELKGVDDAYPLYGQVRTSRPEPLSSLLAHRGAVVDEALLTQLGVAIGDQLRIGQQHFVVRGVLTHEPDRAFRAFSLGPRVMVHWDALDGTGLTRPGAEFYTYTHIKLPNGQNAHDVLSRIDQTFPNSGWRMVNAHEGVPGVGRTLAMAEVLMLFIAMGVMLVGGAGISGAVRAHITHKLSTIAILKSIGTPPNVIALAIGFQVAFGAVLGAMLGIVVGGLGPLALSVALKDQVPFVLSPWPDMGALAASGAFGVLVAALFSWMALSALRDVTMRSLLRERFDHMPGRVSQTVWLGAALIAAAIVGVVFVLSSMALVSVGFLLGGLVLAGLYWGLGLGFVRVARWAAKRIGQRQAGMRLALGNLSRPGAPTSAVVMALGLTLTLLVALDGVQHLAAQHMGRTLPRQAPDLVAFSISPEDAAVLSARITSWPELNHARIVPFLHARVQSIKGVPVRDANVPGSLKWVVRGDRGVSVSQALPQGSVLTEGAWWSSSQNQDALFSVDDGFASRVGLRIGDTITLNISGHVVAGRVANFRHVDWTGLDLDFPIIMNPGALNGVAYTYAASLRSQPGQLNELKRRLYATFPDLPHIEVGEVIQSLSGVMDTVLSGLRLAALMTGVAATMVLGGSVLQGLRERMDEALLFKVLGARQTFLLWLLVVEFALLGVMVSSVALPLGMAVAGGVAHGAKLPDADLVWRGGLALAIGTVLVTICVGVLATWKAYGAAPALYLRRRAV